MAKIARCSRSWGSSVTGRSDGLTSERMMIAATQAQAIRRNSRRDVMPSKSLSANVCLKSGHAVSRFDRALVNETMRSCKALRRAARNGQ